MFYIHLAQHQGPPLTTAVFDRLNTDIVWRKHSYIAKPISANISLLVHDLLLIYLILLCQKYEKKEMRLIGVHIQNNIRYESIFH